MAISDGPAGADPKRVAWPMLSVAAVAILCLLVLAATGLANAGAAVGSAVLIGLCAAAFNVRPEASALPGTVAGPTSTATTFGLIVRNLDDPILLVSGSDRGDLGDRRYLFANDAARDLLRLQRDEGPLTMAIRAPEVLAAVEDALFGNVLALAPWHSRGAQERFWSVRATPLPADTAAEPRQALLTFRDETEIRRGESTRADFLANASHELRTPLASLTGFIETLRGHARDDPAARARFLGIMQSQAERMGHLIDDLMSLSRIELTEHIRPSGRADLGATVLDVIAALTPQAKARKVSFDLDLPAPGQAIAVGDREQIEQVARNLIENAVKYSGPDGVIAIGVDTALDARAAGRPRGGGHAHLSVLTPDRAPNQRYVGLSVRDNGAGIARNHLPRLTERFYRVEGQKSRERPGTGLGLAIVKHIVNRHRGGMVVESGVGAGSIFTVYVPMAEDVAPSATVL